MLGLSAHNRQLERRKRKYPTHFALINNEWHITAELAHFIAHCKQNTIMQPKGGSHE